MIYGMEGSHTAKELGLLKVLHLTVNGEGDVQKFAARPLSLSSRV